MALGKTVEKWPFKRYSLSYLHFFVSILTIQFYFVAQIRKNITENYYEPLQSIY